MPAIVSRAFGLQIPVASRYQEKAVPPRPAGLLLANSIVFAAASLFLGGFGVASLLDWRFGAALGVIVVGVPGLTLGCLQYWTIFRGNVLVAEVFAVFLIAAAGLLVWISGTAEAPYPEFAAIWFVLTAAGAIHWCRQLRAATRTPAVRTDEVSPPMVRVAAGLRPPPVTRLGWGKPLIALLVALAGAAAGYHEIPPQEGRHAPRAATHLDLPAGANDVCFIRSAMHGTPVLYDFAVDEESFLQWVKARPEPIEMLPVEERTQPSAATPTIILDQRAT